LPPVEFSGFQQGFTFTGLARIIDQEIFLMQYLQYYISLLQYCLTLETKAKVLDEKVQVAAL